MSGGKSMARLLKWAAVVLGLCFTSGCATSSSPRPQANAGGGGWKSSSQASPNGGFDLPVVKHPPGTTGTVAVRAGLLPLGQVPYDNLSLPIVSPDGHFVATQTGIAPTWETVTAGMETSLPELTRIEIYRLDRRENIPDKDHRQEPQLLVTLREPALLGRSCDANGFLIESPRQDGSRWIGKASWSTGEIKWLINDGHVNAFASLGVGGRLAWSRRSLPQPSELSGLSADDAKAITSLMAAHFDLVIRTSAGEWTLARTSPDDDWVMPSWCGREDRLFVMHVTSAGLLEAVYANAASAAAFRQSIQRFQVSSASTISTAYQALSGTIGVADAPPPIMDQLVYFHPSHNRMAFWRPLGPPNRKSMFLNPNSITAVLDELDMAIVATDKLLIRQRLSNYNQRITLTNGTVIPRSTWASDWPYILLAPLEGRIGITAMRMMPVDPRTPLGRVE